MTTTETQPIAAEAATDESAAAAEPNNDNGYTKAEQAHYQEICAQNLAVGRLASIAAAAKDEAKAAKGAYDGAAAALCALIRRGPDLQQKLPGMEDVDRPADEWRDLPLSEAGIVGGLAKSLHKAGIDTLGKLANWPEDGNMNIRAYRALCVNVDGTGTTKADKIGELLRQFWAAHPEFCEEPGEAEDADAEEDDGDESGED